MSEVYLSLGSNEGDSRTIIRNACSAVGRLDWVEFVSASSLYITEPMGMPGARWFVNCAAKIKTSLPPLELLEKLEKIEAEFGRGQKGGKSGRTLDLDMLLFGDQNISSDRLTVPHPEMTKRKFVLEPLAEIAQASLDIGGATLSGLLKSVENQKTAKAEPFAPSVNLRGIAVEGPIGVGKTSLVEKLSAYFGARSVLELPSENPFLSGFYENAEKHALGAQLSFLTSRLRLSREAETSGAKMIVTDYLPDKDLLFARLNLSGDELRLYNEVRSLVHYKPAAPDLAIFLSAEDDALMQRIKNRARDCEKGISEKYVGLVNRAYKDWFTRYDGSPALLVDSNGMNFGSDMAAFGKLLWRISGPVNGREVFHCAEDARK